MMNHERPAETRKDAMIAPHATAPADRLLMRLPKPAFTRKPTNGSNGIRTSMTDQNDRRRTRGTRRAGLLREFCELRVHPWFCSPFERREHVRVQRFAVAEQADDDGQ